MANSIANVPSIVGEQFPDLQGALPVDLQQDVGPGGDLLADLRPLVLGHLRLVLAELLHLFLEAGQRILARGLPRLRHPAVRRYGI